MRKTLSITSLNFTLLFGAIIILMLPAIRNGYPLFYSDSASYIASGYEGVVPIDRPIIYGLFVRHISLSYSLWFVVFVQAVFFVGLTWISIKSIKLSGRTTLYVFITCALIGLFTGASNYISQIMPDIFSAYMIWAIALILISEKFYYRWWLLVFAIFSSMVHFSNLLTVSIISVVLIFIAFIFQRNISCFRILIIQLFSLLILPWILMLLLNYSFQKELFINKSSNIFFTGRLIETGILDQYFSRYPESSQYSLFSHRGHLPDKSWQFAWIETSPLYDGECIKSGWGTCWLVKSDEYGKMIRSVLTKSDLFHEFVQISMKDWVKQTTDFEIGLLTQLGETSTFKDITARYFDDAYMFRKSSQYQEDLWFKTESKIQHIFIIISIFILSIVSLFYLKFRFNKGLLIMLLFIVVCLLLNALICSTFSGVLNRYQGRVVWMLPMLSVWFAIFFLQINLKTGSSQMQNSKPKGEIIGISEVKL